MSDLFQQLGIVRWATNHSVASSQPVQMTECATCGMQHHSGQAVLGLGSNDADIMVVYEATESYDELHSPSSLDRSEQLLTAMLKAVGLRRDEIYIVYILRCERQALDTARYTSSLQDKVKAVKPKLLLAVGNTAAGCLSTSSLESLRSKLNAYGDEQTPLTATYHPAYLLKYPTDKKKAFADLQFAVGNL